MIGHALVFSCLRDDYEATALKHGDCGAHADNDSRSSILVERKVVPRSLMC